MLLRRRHKKAKQVKTTPKRRTTRRAGTKAQPKKEVKTNE